MTDKINTTTKNKLFTKTTTELVEKITKETVYFLDNFIDKDYDKTLDDLENFKIRIPIKDYELRGEFDGVEMDFTDEKFIFPPNVDFKFEVNNKIVYLRDGDLEFEIKGKFLEVKFSKNFINNEDLLENISEQIKENGKNFMEINSNTKTKNKKSYLRI